jgi:PDZ domain-containing protein
MNLERWRGLWTSRRARRRATAGTVLLIIAAALGAQNAPYASVSSGPTPDLTAAVISAQTSGHVADPTLGSGGRLLATTIYASQMSWFSAIWCSVRPSRCAMTPIDTSDRATQLAAKRQMSQSRGDAAAAALTLAAATSTYKQAELNASLGDVGGPSAGLMLTLTFIDAMTAGDLTGGRVVAGTGTIDPDGNVGAIQGLKFKVPGAYRAGARVFFAPEYEVAEARAFAPPDMTVVSVSTAADALRWLCAHGGKSSACVPAGPK